MPKPSLRVEHVERTRAALLRAGRRLFAAHGYGGVTTEQIVREARVTRGALYHHFRDKRELFRAVADEVADELNERIEAAAEAAPDAWSALMAGLHAFLDGCLQPAMQRIVILDGPSVLGWEEWRATDTRHGLGLLTEGLRMTMEAGAIPAQPAEPLAHLLLGALNEAAMVIARSDDVEATRAEVGASLERLLGGLRSA